MSEREPVFNIPGIVTVLLAVMIGVHLLRLSFTPETDEWFIGLTAFVPWRYAGGAAELPGGTLAEFTSPFTHMFVHGDIVHLGFNSAWLLAFGGAIAKRVGTLRFLALFAFTGLCGALAFYVAHPGLPLPIVGASGAISGLMGATMRFLFSALDDGGVPQLRDDVKSVRRMSLIETLSDQRILLATGVWLIVNALAAIGVGTPGASGPIAWEAHIGGFLAGILAFSFFDLASARSKPSQPFSN